MNIFRYFHYATPRSIFDTIGLLTISYCFSSDFSIALVLTAFTPFLNLIISDGINVG